MMSLRCARPAFFRSVALLLISAASAHAAAPVTADNVVKTTDCSFGEVHAFSVAGCSFTLENVGSKPISLSVVPIAPGNTVEPSSLKLAPHSSAKVAARVPTDNIAGVIASSFRVEGADVPPVLVQAQGFVMSALDNPRPKIDFGDVDATKGPIPKSIQLTSSLIRDIRIEKVLSSPSFLRAKIGKDSRTLVAEIDKDAPWGLFDEPIKLAIDTPQQKEVWVEATGNVIGDVGPEMNPYWFGSIAWQPSRTLTLPLIDRAGRDFSIGTVTAKGFAATFDSADCEPVRQGCRALRIHVADSQAPGFFRTDLDVALPHRGRHLALTIWGLLGGKPVSGSKGASSPDKSDSSLHEANDKASPPPLKTQPEPPGEGPLLKWTVAQQGNVYGYQVFRGDSPDGPFTLSNPQTIPVIDNGRGPVKYQWRDAEAVKGRTYWYYIAIVYKNGVRQALSGAQKTVAK